MNSPKILYGKTRVVKLTNNHQSMEPVANTNYTVVIFSI